MESEIDYFETAIRGSNPDLEEKKKISNANVKGT